MAINSYFLHRDVKLCVTVSLVAPGTHPTRRSTHVGDTHASQWPEETLGDWRVGQRESKYKTTPDSQCNWNTQKALIYQEHLNDKKDDFRVFLSELSH